MPGSLSHLDSPASQSDPVARMGGWLFRHRTSLPLPIVIVLLVVPPAAQPPATRTTLLVAGILVVAAGEVLRLWAVHHIGVISRTRSDRLGPLIATGPFSLVRNPLYLGNILLWFGFALSARLPWVAPLVVLLLALEYHAIVRWEEGLLEARIGEPYREYTRLVPRWIPRLQSPVAARSSARFSWRETLYSERGTLIAIVSGYLLLALKGIAE